MKILVGCAGIGAESELWEDNVHEITHVEIDPVIAKVLRDRKPNRVVVIGDAFQYLLDHYNEFDFIWISPPCQGNSRMIRSGRNRSPRYPDLRLYEVKIFLDYNFSGSYVIENVIPYYDPLIIPTIKIGRHYFWSNFYISNFREVYQPKNFITTGTVKGSEELKKWLGISYEGNLYYDGNHDPCQVLRNCIHPLIGEHVFNCLLSTNKQE